MAALRRLVLDPRGSIWTDDVRRATDDACARLLVHVSRISQRFIRDPADVLHVGQSVGVRVLEIDLEPRRISLSIRDS
jgi:predicted RNA-binding protein with RPS1 domain